MRGLEKFRGHFSRHSESFVLIGGTACTLAMGEMGLDFRATKDIDIVLIVEALTGAFVEDFWRFVQSGSYQHKQRSTGREIFYRFSNPIDGDYPTMIELFSRQPNEICAPEGCHLTPISISDSAVSLSAILLDDHYYRFAHTGKVQIGGLPCIQAPYLIPLKARAWIDLVARKNQGERVDSRDIRKHQNDIFRLGQLLSGAMRIKLPGPVGDDLKHFLNSVSQHPIDLKKLGVRNIGFEEMLAILRQAYVVE